jgi:hypothetical protein
VEFFCQVLVLRPLAMPVADLSREYKSKQTNINILFRPSDQGNVI